DYAAGAVDQDIGIGAQNRGRQYDAEANCGSHLHGRLGVKKHASRRDVGGFSEVLPPIRCTYGDGELERKTNCAACIVHPSTSRAFIALRRGAPKITLGLFRNQRTRYRRTLWRCGIRTWLLR